MYQKVVLGSLKRVFKVLSLFFVSSVFFVSCSKTNSRDPNVLRVGVSADFAPICFIEDSQLKGFDVDLMNAIAQKMNKKIVWQDLPFDTLIPELTTGKLDLVIGGMSPSEERGKKVLFSRTYMGGGSIVALMKANSPLSASLDWKSAKILVCMGYTTSDEYVSQELKLTPICLHSLLDCILALKAGQGDLLVGPSNCVEQLIIQDRADWKVVYLKEDSAGGSVCMISKDYPELQAPVNKAIDELEIEGMIKKLKLKWSMHD